MDLRPPSSAIRDVHGMFIYIYIRYTYIYIYIIIYLYLYVIIYIDVPHTVCISEGIHGF